MKRAVVAKDDIRGGFILFSRLLQAGLGSGQEALAKQLGDLQNQLLAETECTLGGARGAREISAVRVGRALRGVAIEDQRARRRAQREPERERAPNPGRAGQRQSATTRRVICV